MKLTELVANMPEPMLREICRNNGWAEEQRQWHLGLPQNDLEEFAAKVDFTFAGYLARMLGSEQNIRLINESLYSLERRVLTMIVRRFGYSTFDWAKLERAGQKELSGAALKVALIRLSGKGILFALRKNWGEAGYVLPEDSFTNWTKMLLSVDESKTFAAQAEGLVDSPYRPAIAAQLLAVLSYIAKEDVTVTQKGGIHKRHASRLAALVPIADGELARKEADPVHIKTGYGSTAADFLCCAAAALGLLNDGSERLNVLPHRLAQWFARSEQEMNTSLYCLWKERSALADVWLQHAVSLLERAAEGSWMPIRRLVEHLAQIGAGENGSMMSRSESCRDDQTDRLLCWIGTLAAWGWAETGTAADGERLFRWIRKPVQDEAEPLFVTGEGSAPLNSEKSDEPHKAADCSSFFVQPDFEVIVPPDCPYKVRWELEMIAERIKFEQIAMYRLTRETIVRALDNGRTSDGIKEFLQRQAKRQVPENVMTAIELWGEQHSRLRIESVTVLKFRDEAAAQSVCCDERIATLLAEKLGPTAWSVRADKATELRAMLERSGYSPGGRKDSGAASYPKLDENAVNPANSANAGEAAGERSATPDKGLIYSKAAVKYYDRECNFPPIEDVYPGLQEIPPMWLKDCRTYHASTRKAMIQKALEWKACLKLRTAEAETLFIPLRLDGIRDDWAVTGFELMKEVRLLPNQWEEMQLILPGINDDTR